MMTLAYIVNLGLITQKTSILAQIIEDLALETYAMISASFLLLNSLKRIWFFGKAFLLVITSIEVILKIFFLFFCNADV